MRQLEHYPKLHSNQFLFHQSDCATILDTWFPREVIEKGQKLIDRGDIQSFFYYRQSSAALFKDGVSALAKTVPSDSLTHGFVCRDMWCSACHPGNRSNYRCHHTAAVLLLLLSQSTDEQLFPLPLLFPKGMWFDLGQTLASLRDNSKVQFALQQKGEGYFLQGTSANGLDFQAYLSVQSAAVLASFYQGIDFPKEICQQSIQLETMHRQLLLELLAQNRSEAEKQFAERGHFTRKEQADKSLWMHIFRQLSWNAANQEIIVRRHDNGLFYLTSTGPDEEILFSLTCPRLMTMEILGNIPSVSSKSLPVSKMASAVSCSRVFFAENNSDIIIERCLRLDDGRIYTKMDLADDSYGSYYYLEGEGFVTVRNLPTNQDIVLSEEKQTTLFAFAQKQTKPEHKHIIHRDTIPEFLEKNRTQLADPCHDVAQNVLDMEIIDKPKRLELTDFSETQEWCYLAGSYDLGDQSIDLAELLEKADGTTKFLPGRQWLRLQGTSLSWFHKLGKDRVCTFKDGKTRGIRLRAHEFLALSSQLPDIVPPKEQRTVKSLSTFLQIENVEPSLGFQEIMAHLRDYQKNGAMWLAYLVRHNLSGLLADDMGLGKTHQALSCIQYLTQLNKGHKILIVCPTGVLWNWLEKAEQYFPDLPVKLYYGAGRDRSSIPTAPVLLTSYGTLRNDIENIAPFPFELVIFDEMQQLKNSKTKIHIAAEMLDSKSIIGLTGTPIENSLMELCALFNICLPGFFKNKEFYNHYIRSDSPKTRKALRTITRPFILRRTRAQVLKDLPPVIEDIRICRLHQDQEHLYQEFLTRNESLRNGLVNNEQVNFMNVLTMITRLKQICNHPCMLEDCDDTEYYGSGKWEQFKEIIEECLTNQYKVVVFSQYTKMLDLMQKYFESKDITYGSIRGDMTAQKRQETVRRFNGEESCHVCLVSLLAGGVGIDLTAAQVVVHYDRWWNPAKEEQATARVHRMGQTEVVQVIKLLTKNTLEEKLHFLLQKKQALANDVISEDDAFILKNISKEDLIDLFSLE